MTRVKIEISTGEGYYSLAAKGHATGSPEVCNGISAILYSLAGFMLNAQEDGRGEILLQEMDSGDVVLAASGDEWMEAAWVMAAIGLQQIELDNREFLQVDLKYT